MNAVTAAPANSALPAILARISVPGSAAKTTARPTQAPAAFSNVINALLGAPATATANTSSEDSSPTDVLPPQSAPADPLPIPLPPAQLADAMIRSMLGLAGKVAQMQAPTASSDVKISAGVKKTPASAGLLSQTASVFPQAFLPHLPALQSADTFRAAAASQKLSASGLPFGATVVPAANSSSPAAPLAFSMKVAPVADATPAPQPAPAVANSTQAAPAATAAPPTGPAVTNSAVDAKPADDSKCPATEPAGGKTRAEAATREDAPVAAVAAAGANTSDGTNDFSRDFARQVPADAANAAAAAGVGKSSVTSAPASAMEALRSSEPPAPSTPIQSLAPVKEITVRMTAPQSPAVDLHLAERAGQLHVAVRTADGGLQTSLRQDLGSLVNALERSGYRAEAFAPREGAQTLAASATMNSQNGRQEPESGSGGRSFGDPSQNSGSGQQQQRRDPRQPQWLEELENQQ